MEPTQKNLKQVGHYKPRRHRTDNSFLQKSASSNNYRKGPSKKLYKKKTQEYAPQVILSFKDHSLSKIEPPSPFYLRKLTLIQKHPLTPLHPKVKTQALDETNSESTWRLVPKPIKSELDDMTKTLKSLLNKLTPTNFDSIKDKLIKLISPQSSKIFSNLLITKACLESKYVETYTQLACELTKKFAFFRLDLIGECEDLFGNLALETQDIGINKKKVLGCVCFLGELMNKRFISGKVGIYCCEQLISKGTEEAAEGVCYLLSACDRIFESGRYKEEAHFLVKRLQEMCDGFSLRVKFQVQDVVQDRKIHKFILDGKEKPYSLGAN